MSRIDEVLKQENGNYMLPFFWQHGEDEHILRKYMHAIHEANIGEVCVESRPHPDFLGEKWWEDMDVILEEASSLGMRVWILDDSHFPTGFANGAIKNAPKKLHHKYLCCRTLEVSGPAYKQEFEVKQYMQPAPPPPWVKTPKKSDDDFSDDTLVKILACPVMEGEELGKPIDITDHMEQGKIVFDLPEGYFKIYVIYITRNGRGRNDYINFLDKESCRLLIDTVYEPHYAHYKKYFGNVIAGFFSDEPPVGNVDGYIPVGTIGKSEQDLPWSDAAWDAMTRQFESEEWIEFIPYLWAAAEDKKMQAKIRCAYMDMVTTLIEENFSKQNGQWCEEHGVSYIGHMLEDCDMNMSLGASMGHFFRGLSGQHMAGIDNIGGQVMIDGWNAVRHSEPVCDDEAGFYHYMLGKMGASHAAIDHKKMGRTMCENFGAYGWQFGTREQKYMLDHFMVRGVNYFVPHAFSPAKFPDPDCPPHFYAHGENPLYRAFGQLMAYGNRVCHLINGGNSKPDVAVLYGAEGVWSGGGNSAIPICRGLSQEQVDFHIIPADVFNAEKEYLYTFDRDNLCVNNIVYHAIIIPGCVYLEKHVAEFVEEAVESGFPVVFTDKVPDGIIGASDAQNKQFKEVITKCVVVCAHDIGKYLKNSKLFTVQTAIEPENKYITTYHYQSEGQEELLLLNEMSGTTYEGYITAQADGIPVRYDPWKNMIEQVEYEKQSDNSLRLKLKIEPLELCMIIFDEEKKYDASKRQKKSIYDVNEKITQEFVIDKFRVGRVESKDYLNQLNKSQSGLYSQHSVVEVEEWEDVTAPFGGMQRLYPDFSGYYIYEAEIQLEENMEYEIVIDKVCEAAELFFNERSLGMLIQGPYRYKIPRELVCEKNKIRIEVATLPERKARDMGAELTAMSAFRPLSPTGIVGNVTVYKR